MEYQLVRWRKYGHDRVYVKSGEVTLGHLDRATGRLHLDGADNRAAIVAALIEAGHLSPQGLPTAPETRELPAPSIETDSPATAESAVPLPLHQGRPGASLQQEADRMRAKRESEIRTAHPKSGGLILAMRKEPVKSRVLAQGAAGERKIAAKLEELAGPEVFFLHNRLCGHGRRDGDIDHIAVAPSGIYVIDAKHYPDASVEVRRTGGLLTPREERLYIRGRDSTKLLVSIRRQYDAVKTALSDLDGAHVVPVFSAFCFLGANLPLLWSESIEGVPLYGPRRMAKAIRKEGPMNERHRTRLLEHLAARLPAAG